MTACEHAWERHAPVRCVLHLTLGGVLGLGVALCPSPYLAIIAEASFSDRSDSTSIAPTTSSRLGSVQTFSPRRTSMVRSSDEPAETAPDQMAPLRAVHASLPLLSAVRHRGQGAACQAARAAGITRWASSCRETEPDHLGAIWQGEMSLLREAEAFVEVDRTHVASLRHRPDRCCTPLLGIEHSLRDQSVIGRVKTGHRGAGQGRPVPMGGLSII